MKINLLPKTVGFKSGILFFNLSTTTHKIVSSDIKKDYDIAFIFDAYTVYVSLDQELSFGVLEQESGEMYGPYSDYVSVVTLHLFGRYDNLMSFLKNSFFFDDGIGEYVFLFEGFRYSRGAYEFTASTAKTARSLAAYLPAINEPFEYAFVPETVFNEGAIEIFVNRLNVMYNQNNFEEGGDDSDDFLIGSIDRSSGYGFKRNNGKSFFCANLSSNRHSMFFVPVRTPDGYVSFLSDGDTVSDEILNTYVTNAQKTTVTNQDDVDEYVEKYGIQSTGLSVDLLTYTLFDNILFALTPDDNAREMYLFVKLNAYGVIPILFDSFTKTFTIMSSSTIPTIAKGNSELEYRNGTLLFASDSGTQDMVDNKDFGFKAGSFEVYVDTEHNRAYSRDGNVFAINYAGNLLNQAFVQ